MLNRFSLIYTLMFISLWGAECPGLGAPPQEAGGGGSELLISAPPTPLTPPSFLPLTPPSSPKSPTSFSPTAQLTYSPNLPHSQSLPLLSPVNFCSAEMASLVLPFMMPREAYFVYHAFAQQQNWSALKRFNIILEHHYHEAYENSALSEVFANEEMTKWALPKLRKSKFFHANYVEAMGSKSQIRPLLYIFSAYQNQIANELYAASKPPKPNNKGFKTNKFNKPAARLTKAQQKRARHQPNYKVSKRTAMQLELLKMAASLGCEAAQVVLVHSLRHGKNGFPKNVHEGCMLIDHFAFVGNEVLQEMYTTGLQLGKFGFRVNHELARENLFKWYAHGSLFAKLFLGKCLRAGMLGMRRENTPAMIYRYGAGWK